MKTPLDDPASSLVDSVKTHRYRRLTMATLVPLLFAALSIEGNRKSDDALLTVPGMLMTVVAFVPTVHVGACRSVAATFVLARAPFLVEGVLIALFAAFRTVQTHELWNTIRRRRTRRRATEPAPTPLMIKRARLSVRCDPRSSSQLVNR